MDKENMFVLGKGYGEAIALEGALKIKEMTYVHAEGYSGGALKHGPFALIEGAEGRNGQTPVICLIFDDDHAAHMRTCAEEVKARGARVYVITDNPKLAQGIDSRPIGGLLIIAFWSYEPQSWGLVNPTLGYSEPDVTVF